MKHSDKKPIHNLALNLRNLRGSMTQERLAELSGLTKNAISLIENEERWPRKKTLSSIAKALGTTVDELLKVQKLKIQIMKMCPIRSKKKLSGDLRI